MAKYYKIREIETNVTYDDIYASYEEAEEVVREYEQEDSGKVDGEVREELVTYEIIEMPILKKYKVEAFIDNAEQIRGKEPHSEIRHDVVGDYVEAETEDEAVSLALDYIAERCVANGYEADIDGDKMTVYKDGETVEQYYNLTAKEVG